MIHIAQFARSSDIIIKTADGELELVIDAAKPATLRGNAG